MSKPPPLPTRAEILEEFKNAKHTSTSRSVPEMIEAGEAKVQFRRRLAKKGMAWGTSIRILHTRNMGEMLATLVHEGRHCLDIREGRIPADNPSGLVCLIAEMVAWSEAARFAVLNGYSDTVAFKSSVMGPRELAISVEKRYHDAIGIPLDDADLENAIQEFKKRRDEIQDA